MNSITGVSIQDAAKGLGISQCQLRNHLAGIRAIEKTNFGWVARPQFISDGLLYTDARQTHITTETGQHIPKHYTVVLVTGNGIAWLHEQLQSNRMEKTA